jgi:Cu/Ag efflux protein CusF
VRTTTNRIALLFAGLVALGAPIAALAQQAPTTTSATSVGQGKATTMKTTSASAKIVSIDKAKRIVLLKDSSGKIFEIGATSDIKNFDQLKAGQMVRARYTEAISVELKKAGTAAPVQEHFVTASAANGPPGAGVARQVSAVADVVSVDHAANEVTLRGAGGAIVAMHIQDPAQMKDIKVGDHVEAVYTEALAITVDPAK